MHGPRSETPAACGAQEFYNHLREVDRENEVNRILGAFKLNPFEQLGVKFTVTPEDVRRAYRKVRPGRHERAAGPLAPRGHADVPPPRRLTSAAVPLLRTEPEVSPRPRTRSAGLATWAAILASFTPLGRQIPAFS